jgi:hypothetical protein
MNKVVFTFGKFNPPTKGHLLVVDEIKRLSNQFGCSYKIFTSQKKDNKRNPLSYEKKILFAEKILQVNIEQSREIVNIFDVIKSLEKDGYDDLIMVVGSDRKKVFEKKLLHYVGGEFNINSLQIVSAGIRDCCGSGVSAISSSKMRQYAKDNNFEAFRVGLPKTIHNKDTKSLYTEVQKGLLNGRKNNTKLGQ